MKIGIEVLRSSISYDPSSGEFRWRVKPNRRIRVGDLAGTLSKGRKVISIQGEFIPAGRAAWAIFHGQEPTGVIDHINGDPLDNRILNLRDVSIEENTQNRRSAQSNSKSGMLGATWHKHMRRWRAAIVVRGRSMHIGYFETADAAHAAYVASKREMHSGNTI